MNFVEEVRTNMIRVLHVLASMNIGGAETFIMNVYRNIDRNKVQFDFLLHTNKISAYNDEILALGGKIFCISPRNEGVLKNYIELNNFFKHNNEYRIVHQHLSSLSYVEPLKFARKYGVPIRILHSHSTREGGSFFHKYIHNLNKLSVEKVATNYFACSDLAAKWMFGKKQYNSNNYDIINNGVSMEKFSFENDSRIEMRKTLGLDNKFIVGHLGNFVYPKNHEFIIQLFKKIKEQNPESILMLVGDGDLREKIEKNVAELGLRESVIFTGTRKEVQKYLWAMDVFVFPSHYEGFPVTLVEAQASGLPCVVSTNITRQVSITNDIYFMDLKSGIEAWANKIIELGRKNDRCNKSNQIIDLEFDIANVAKKLESFYEESMD